MLVQPGPRDCFEQFKNSNLSIGDVCNLETLEKKEKNIDKKNAKTQKL